MTVLAGSSILVRRTGSFGEAFVSMTLAKLNRAGW